MRALQLIAAAILWLCFVGECHARTSPEDSAVKTSTVQGKFDRAIPRVEQWVRTLLGRTDPIVATAEVLDAESFAIRAPVPEGREGKLPLVMVAVTTPDAEILVNQPVFEAMSDRAAAEALFEDDVVMLIVAHELTHAAHLEMLPAVETGPFAAQEDAEQAAAALIMREAHAAMVQRSVASTIGGEDLEKFCRDAYASTPIAPERNALAESGILILKRALDAGGVDAVREVLENPPVSPAQILLSASPEVDLAQSLSELLLKELPASGWVPMTRRGPEAAIGQGWGWMKQQDREAVQAELIDSFLLALIDRGSATPKMISVSVLEFESPDAAAGGLERLATPIELIASRFGYTASGTKRSTQLVPDADGWRSITGRHPIPGGDQAFGVLAVRQIGSRVMIFNGVGTPGSVSESRKLLRVIAESS